MADLKKMLNKIRYENNSKASKIQALMNDYEKVLFFFILLIDAINLIWRERGNGVETDCRPPRLPPPFKVSLIIILRWLLHSSVWIENDAVSSLYQENQVIISPKAIRVL